MVSRLVNDGGGTLELTTNYDELLEKAFQQTDEPATNDWRTDWTRSLAILAAALYFTCSMAGAEIFGPVVLDELRDNAIAAIAIYGGLREWNKRNRR
jgi:hypothetical protein